MSASLLLTSLALTLTAESFVSVDGSTELDATPDAGVDGGVVVIDGGPASDAGSAPDAGGCGSVTYEGECQGTTLIYCSMEDELITVDCTEEYEPNATCAQISVEHGYDCLVPVGSECLYDDGEGGAYAAFCQGSEPGCLETATDSLCTAALGSCTEDDVDTCRDDRLLLECVVNQPYMFDCMSLGGRCVNGACVELPVDTYCDDQFQCANGLTCQQETCRAGAPPPVDAGTSGVEDTGTISARDSGTSSGRADGGKSTVPTTENDKGCGCGVALADRRGDSTAAGATLLLLALLLRSRSPRQRTSKRTG